MYVPITFVGLPLDFRKKGPEVGCKKSVGWMVAFEKQTRETLTVCCRSARCVAKTGVFVSFVPLPILVFRLACT